MVDISRQIDKKIDANRANVAKGPGGHSGSRLRAELAKSHQRLPLLGDDDVTADRNYIREFILTHTATWVSSTAWNTPRCSTISPQAHPAPTATRAWMST